MVVKFVLIFNFALEKTKKSQKKGFQERPSYPETGTTPFRGVQTQYFVRLFNARTFFKNLDSMKLP